MARTATARIDTTDARTARKIERLDRKAAERAVTINRRAIRREFARMLVEQESE